MNRLVDTIGRPGPRPCLVALLGAALCLNARADIVVHEFIPPDPEEDLGLGATTPDGAMAAAIKTHSGAVSAPEVLGSRPLSAGVYGGAASRHLPDDRYRIDSDTERPQVVSYDDPFTPTVAPFKRQSAYDFVDGGFELVVFDPELTPIVVGGSPRPEDDQFYADMQVDLVRGQPVRIPSVGPSARVLAASVHPELKFELLADGADNWFIEADETVRVRLIMHVAIDRAVFGSALSPVDWETLARFTYGVDERVEQSGREVAEAIGVTRALAPREALRVMVQHFRSFSPSPDRPEGRGEALYRALSLEKVGVCRHRAYAFVVTALALGIPARLVKNEAHAWVEVFDSVRWHRIDLGGAAERLDAQVDERPPHVVPRDPYAWPAGAESGQSLADRSRRQAGAGSRSGSRSSPVTAPPGAPSSPRVLRLNERSEPADDRPESTVSLDLVAKSAARGQRVEVSGTVASDGEPCPRVRVDLALKPLSAAERSERRVIATLVTDGAGRYEGAVVVPYDVGIGDYSLVAGTPGNSRCGRGQSR